MLTVLPPSLQSVLTQNAYFDPIFCKNVADTVSGSVSAL